MKKLFHYIPSASMIIMLIGLIFFLFVNKDFGLYTFGGGAILLAITRMITLIQSQNTGGKADRLPQIRVMSAIVLLFAAYLMYDHSNSWSVLLLISAIIEMYVSFRQK